MKTMVDNLLIFIFVILSSCSSPIDQHDNLSSSDKSLGQKTDSLPLSDSMEVMQLVKEYDLNRIDTFKVGDVNGDGKMDMALIQPTIFISKNNKIDSQYVPIKFSCNIMPIMHYNGFHGLVVSAGDLDGNGTDDIIYMPDWYTSDWAGFFIYALRQNNWVLFGSGSIRRDIVWEAKNPMKYLKSRVKKVNNNKFKMIDHILTEDGEFSDSTSIITIK